MKTQEFFSHSEAELELLADRFMTDRLILDTQTWCENGCWHTVIMYLDFEDLEVKDEGNT